MLNFCDFIQVYVFITNHHLNNIVYLQNLELQRLRSTSVPKQSEQSALFPATNSLERMLYGHTFSKCAIFIFVASICECGRVCAGAARRRLGLEEAEGVGGLEETSVLEKNLHSKEY